ncbi:MAG TPA: TadE/TadG family type IV pilus assembly protein [Egicoccus sp.]|nr:TadE/TadG family type IV pilus assembly protein [Egicoccus sp.]HSK22819.1 TadE/TadG family type IV pilus assembly protein [Egicoccus sp.]
MSRRATHLRREDGAFSAEFVAVVPLLLIVALIAWQALMVVSAGNAAAAAARNGSRAIATGEGASAAVARSLPDWLQDGHRVRRGLEAVEVEVTVPPVVRGIPLGGFTLTREAELPDTSLPVLP